jgi:glycine dehydrogenase
MVFFESAIRELQIIHDNGGLVYMDANMNAQVGLTNPQLLVLMFTQNFCYSSWWWWTRCRTNLCKRKISSVLPSNPLVQVGGKSNYSYFWCSLWLCFSMFISYGYICMLGSEGITNAKYAILNANYMKARLEEHYQFCILEKRSSSRNDIRFRGEVSDIAKRLMDYGFHAPTVSFQLQEL